MRTHSMELLKKLYLPPADEFVLVDVPELQFAMIDGEGDPHDVAGTHALRWLFASVYPIRRLGRERMGARFVEAPLECLWWADDLADFVAARKDRMKWRMMIVMPDWLDEARFRAAVAEAGTKLGEAPESLRLEGYHEGQSVQIMHHGPNEREAATIARMHNEFLPRHGLTPHGHHHEIYLTDPRRVAPERRRTVLRQPVRRRE